MNESDADLFARMRETSDAHLSFAPSRRRLAGWESALAVFVGGRLYAPFAWGESDCCLFACDAIVAVSGRDPAAWFRGRYSDMRGATLALREFSDGGDLEAVAERIAFDGAYDEIPAAFAQRGDCVLVETDLGKALGVMVDHRIAVQGPTGLVIGADLSILRAWAI